MKTADLAVLPTSCFRGRIAGVVTRTEQRAYIRAEHERLTAEHLRLRSAFETLRMNGFPQQELGAHIRRMRAYIELLENHLIGLDWMRRPPWERI